MKHIGIIGVRLMTETELDEILTEMKQLIADPETYERSFTVTQVWGRKPRN